MKITFLGAAQTVTGSCFVVETQNTRFAIDCGMHQGSAIIEKRNTDYRLYNPQSIDFTVITHAHMDHSGLLPFLVKHGFGSKIYATPPTVALLKIMLADAGHIQEVEAFWKNKKLLRRGGKTIDPLFTVEDAAAVLPLLTEISYDVPFSPFPEITITFKDAGHILGSAFVIVDDNSSPVPLKTVFSGDIGRIDQFIVNDPTIISSADYLVMESTYGDRAHRNDERSLEELGEAIHYAHSRNGKVVIPAFAVERTQEVLYALHLLWRHNALPADMPIFVDSPLAIRATEIFKKHRSFFDKETRAIYDVGEDPFHIPNLRYTLSTAESMEINSTETPAIIISASGMANAGRIKHHLRHNLWRENAAVVFVGFQANGTIGRKIVDGVDSVRIFNDDIAVNAKVFTINGFSAHADQKELLEWLAHFTNDRMKILLVHGELHSQQILQKLIETKFRFQVHIPQYLETVQLNPDKLIIGKTGRDDDTTDDYGGLIQEMELALSLLKEKTGPQQSAKILGIAQNLHKLASER
ncbi:MAG: MBL fold metallo-hydrolase [Deltaproteobacteria bacterium]|nr:MBL fold metallo-hydrolase [Deltaproteobacteria bacterium]